ncbi:MAG: YciI family protein [Pyrinomonadaceae bacterium]
MTNINRLVFVLITGLVFGAAVSAQTDKPASKNPGFDAELAKRLGADKRGMKNYVLVILKTGPSAIPAGKERDEIFKGHFANIHRLGDQGKLVVAGPFDDNSDWRGMFIFNVTTIEEAKKLTETDPVIKSGLMIPEFHKLYCSAALMEVNGIHQKIAEAGF